MSYVINRYSGSQLTVIDDATLDTSTSVTLVGRNYTGYGEVQNENFLFLLENFSNKIAPPRPISGQLWYDTVSNRLNVYNGDDWRSAASADVSDIPPIATPGAIWLDTTSNQLYVYNDGWKIIGPEAIAGFGATKLESIKIKDTLNTDRPVILIKIDDVIQGVIADATYTISGTTPIPGFGNLVTGINLLPGFKVKGDLIGNANSASSLLTARNINGVPFDGTINITVRASTTEPLIAGDYLVGSDFDGGTQTTWDINAASENIIGSVVARDSAGDFAAGNITANNFVGNLSGNVSTNTGTSTFNIIEAQEVRGPRLIGNASSASRLEVARLINGVEFNGTQDVTVPAEASTLTGFRLANNVIESSLTTVGTLNSLSIADSGINIASGAIKLYNSQTENLPLIETENVNGLNLRVKDTSVSSQKTSLFFVSGTQALALGAQGTALIAPESNAGIDLGYNDKRFNRFFSNSVNSPTVFTQTITSTAGNGSIAMNGDLTVSGNLTVNGTVTTVNSIDVSIDDLTFTIAADTASQVLADGAGVIINGANARFLYNATGDKMTLNKSLDMGANNVTTTGLFQGVATKAQYADLAERYQADNEYAPGTVLEFGGEFEVTIAEDETRRVAGIVSTRPAYEMNTTLEGRNVVSIALQGRVPCKVRGKIHKGDMLVSGGNGYARPTNDPKLGTIIGKALENFEGSEGVIEVVVGRL